MKRLFLFALVLALLMSVDLGFSTNLATAAEKIRYGGIIKDMNNKEPNKFGYPPSIRFTDQEYAQESLEMLVNLDLKGNVLPCLAEEWEASPDGKTYTFKLRKGVKFHDGTDFNAQAAKWNLDLWIKNPGPVLSSLTSVDVIDEHTIRLNLSRFDALLFYELSTEAYIASPAAINKHGEKWAETNPIGTGPFKFKSYERNVAVRYERNKDYWRKGLPYIDGIEKLVVKNAMTQLSALKTGEGNVIRSMDFEFVETLKKDGFNIDTYAGPHIMLFGDSKNPDSPFSNKKAREAIAYAMDREGIEKNSKGHYSALYQLFDTDNPNYDPSLKPRKYDPVKAKKLLTEAGYPNGIEINVQYYHKLWPESWVYMQAKMANAGIKLKLVPIQRPKSAALKYEGGLINGMHHMQSRMLPEPRYVFKNHFMSTAKMAPDLARPAGIDDLIKSTLSTTDLGKNRALYKKINKLVYDDVMIIPLYVEPRVNAFHPSIQGYATEHTLMAGSTYAYPFYMNMWIKK